MITNIDSLFKNADPIVAGILNNALSEKEISADEGLELFKAQGIGLILIPHQQKFLFQIMHCLEFLLL